MSQARDEVLRRVCAALAAERTAPEIPRRYRRRGDQPGPELLELLTHRLRDYKATVHTCADDGLPAVLTAELAAAGRVLVPPGLPAGWAPATATVDTGFSASELDSYDTVLTACAAACAETGTIALDARPDQGRRAISLVPDRHVCVVRADQVVATVPELLGRLDPRRPLTFISGPSATSDIELQRVEGVHGPRTLSVILVTPRSVPSHA